jgi:hypothetical protein
MRDLDRAPAGDNALGLRSCEPEVHHQSLPISFIK